MIDYSLGANSAERRLIEVYEGYFATGRRDVALLAATASFMHSRVLAQPRASTRNIATCVIVEWNMQFARAVSTLPRNCLRAVLCDAPSANALAVPGACGTAWVVLSTGLLKELAAESERVAGRVLQNFAPAFACGLGQLLRARNLHDNITPDFPSLLGSLMYAGGVSFFIGHELAHHLGGHMPVFGGHAATDEATVDAHTRHALERNADQLGVQSGLFAMTHMLRRHMYRVADSPTLRKQADELVAVLLWTSMLMAYVLFKPASVDWEAHGKRSTHPPNANRLIALQLLLFEATGRLDLTLERRKLIARTSLKLVIGNAGVRTLHEACEGSGIDRYNQALDSAMDAVSGRLKPLLHPDWRQRVAAMVARGEFTAR